MQCQASKVQSDPVIPAYNVAEHHEASVRERLAKLPLLPATLTPLSLVSNNSTSTSSPKRSLLPGWLAKPTHTLRPVLPAESLQLTPQQVESTSNEKVAASSYTAASDTHLASDASSIISVSTTKASTFSQISQTTTRTETPDPGLVRVQGLWVGPCPFDPELAKVWNARIYPQLRAHLSAHLESTWTLEFLLIGKTTKSLRPTVLVTYTSKEAKKEVEKLYKNLDWLRKLNKEHKINFTIMKSNTRLVAQGRTTPAVNARDVQVRLHVSSIDNTYCGRLITMANERSEVLASCIAGGLILVDGNIRLLTAGHAFVLADELDYNGASTALLESIELGNVQESTELDSDRDSGLVIFDECDEDESLSTSSGCSSPETAPYHSEAEPAKGPSSDLDGTLMLPAPLLQDESRAAESVRLRDRSIGASNESNPNASSGCDHDWALLSLDSLPPLPNLDTLGQPVDAFIEIPSEDRNVTIIFREGSSEEHLVLGGILHPLAAAVSVGRQVSEVYRITTDWLWPVGSSGSWVLLDGRVCGQIVAAREHEPCVYMVSMSSVLEDIKDSLGANEVHIMPSSFAGELRKASISENYQALSGHARTDDVPEVQERKAPILHEFPAEFVANQRLLMPPLAGSGFAYKQTTASQPSGGSSTRAPQCRFWQATPVGNSPRDRRLVSTQESRCKCRGSNIRKSCNECDELPRPVSSELCSAAETPVYSRISSTIEIEGSTSNASYNSGNSHRYDHDGRDSSIQTIHFPEARSRSYTSVADSLWLLPRTIEWFVIRHEMRVKRCREREKTESPSWKRSISLLYNKSVAVTMIRLWTWRKLGPGIMATLLWILLLPVTLVYFSLFGMLHMFYWVKHRDLFETSESKLERYTSTMAALRKDREAYNCWKKESVRFFRNRNPNWLGDRIGDDACENMSMQIQQTFDLADKLAMSELGSKAPEMQEARRSMWESFSRRTRPFRSYVGYHPPYDIERDVGVCALRAVSFDRTA